MRIYLDICCFNRPFDDQSQLLIRLQTEAKLHIQEAIRQGIYDLVWSAVMDLENLANPDDERREAIGDWKALATVKVVTDNQVEALAEELALIGGKADGCAPCRQRHHREYRLATDNGSGATQKNALPPKVNGMDSSPP